MDSGRSIVHRKKKASAASNKTCDSKKKASKASWTATSKKALLADGSERVLYRHPDRPGELRLRRIRDGKATYVKPGKTVRVRMMRGGSGDDDLPDCNTVCHGKKTGDVVRCKLPNTNKGGPQNGVLGYMLDSLKPAYIIYNETCK